MSDFTQPSGAQRVAEAILAAEEIIEPSEDRNFKPRLLIDLHDPASTVERLRDLLSASELLYERGVPVILVHDQLHGGMKVQVVTPDLLVLIAHKICRPYLIKELRDGIVEKNTRLPIDIARMYLAWQEGWNLPLLSGIASTPMLREDGSIHSSSGYESTSGIWFENIPDLCGLIPTDPTAADAQFALRKIRNVFKTFCFADAETRLDPDTGVEIVDIDQPPGRDESAFLVALLTAAARSSIDKAPGILIRAASLSGAGAGKGLLARGICKVAFGKNPHAVTAGQSPEELEKRIGAELIEGSQILFLDNLNNRAFKSDQLASAITEDPARIRLFGKLQMARINTSAFVLLTGNGLTVSEDLARRFVVIELDPKTENPEARTFSGDILAEVSKRREELLGACLTIWRWGRLNSNLKSGIPLGSFARWCRWVRDPLLALGCQDPATRVSEAKQQDTRRQRVSEIFSAWWERHGDEPTYVNDLCEDVKNLIDPQRKSPQNLNTQVQGLAGTRIAGFMLIKNKGNGKWSRNSYTLKKTDRAETHRDHRGHKSSDDPPVQPNSNPISRDFVDPDPSSNTVSTGTGDIPAATCDPCDPYAFGGQNSERHNPSGWTGQI
jgi:hypothetical protein